MTTQPVLSETNRRSNRRKGVRCMAAIHLPDREPQKAMTTDLGADGVSFHFARPIAPGTRCRISFELPLDGRSQAIDTPIKTVYSSYCGPDGFRIGAIFTDPDPQSSAALREFIELDN